MGNFKTTQTIDISVSPKEAADIFCDMDGEQQAKFFNSIAENVKTWDSLFVFQLQEILNTKKLTKDGQKIMSEIGQYSYDS